MCIVHGKHAMFVHLMKLLISYMYYLCAMKAYVSDSEVDGNRVNIYNKSTFAGEGSKSFRRGG